MNLLMLESVRNDLRRLLIVTISAYLHTSGSVMRTASLKWVMQSTSLGKNTTVVRMSRRNCLHVRSAVLVP